MPSSKNPTPASPIFRFKNLGPIEEAELELGDLTIIAGRNNTGKTYLTYTLYGFLKVWNNWTHYLLEPYPERKRNAPDIVNLIQKASEEGQSKCKLTKEYLEKYRNSTIASAAEGFSTYALYDVFNSSRENFINSSIEIMPPKYPSKSSEYRLDFKNRSYSMEYHEGELTVCVKRSDERRPRPHDELSSTEFYSRLYANYIFPELRLNPFILSTERLGISLFYRELDFAKNEIIDILQKMGTKDYRNINLPRILGEGTSRYSMPIKNNITYTRNLSDIRQLKSEVHGSKLYDDIKEMMNGYYKITKDGDIRFISTARKENRFDIPLHIASSSARELSDLYFYLRHKAEKEHLLIIDEPESHLDTNNQREMARLIGRIVRSGIKVLITTHSDYLIKEINNLVMLHSLNDPAVYKRLKYNANEGIDPSLIRAYIAEAKGLKQCSIDKYGIDMPVFDDTIDDINRVSNELTDRILIEDE